MSVEAYFTDEVLSGAVSVSASTDTYPGKFSEQLDNWIFSPDRKAGDKDILEKEDGFYVVYFISESDKPEWYDRVNSFIRMNNYQAFLNEMLTEYTFEFKPSGLAQIVDIVAGGQVIVVAELLELAVSAAGAGGALDVVLAQQQLQVDPAGVTDRKWC